MHEVAHESLGRRLTCGMRPGLAPAGGGFQRPGVAIKLARRERLSRPPRRVRRRALPQVAPVEGFGMAAPALRLLMG